MYACVKNVLITDLLYVPHVPRKKKVGIISCRNRHKQSTYRSALSRAQQTLTLYPFSFSQRVFKLTVYFVERTSRTFTRWIHEPWLYCSLSPSRLVFVVLTRTRLRRVCLLSDHEVSTFMGGIESRG